ncbi:hypothetical protein [Alcaligenes sp.]|uniref:hypothetical protein n=1 Tax=Alcaligenes sp. TaxID=512 RepID=UPI003D0874EC
MKTVRLIAGSAIDTQERDGVSSGAAASISWAKRDDEGAVLPCGFGGCNGVTQPKTLAYDEVILVLEGTFGVETDEGMRVEGKAGDVIELPKGVTVSYFGKQARLFFVTN